MKRCYLICNAHIDPAWQWEWEEGVSAGVATFYSAAKLLDENHFVFCHNEAVLYSWVKEYNPALFEKIRAHVEKGDWKIMGGWFLQPDCVMPSGESIVRQIMYGREFFSENFPSAPVPRTAVSFDAFGHNGGLPQILKKCGYDSYLFCRPTRAIRPDLTEEYLWEGCDGSRIRCYHSSVFYLSGMGEARQKIESYLESHQDMESCIVLWGVGNHGGGPSQKDLTDIEALKAESETEFIHSYPEEYFAKEPKDLPVVKGGLVNFAPGCYTSMIRVKQMMCETENLLYATEKMCSVADALGLSPYPSDRFDEAQKLIMMAQFHDILPGSGIKAVEEYGLGLLYSAREILTAVRAKAFFALCEHYPAAEPDTFPNFVFNPHPYETEEEIPLEFMLPLGAFLNDRSTFFKAFVDGKEIPCQLVKERSTVNHDWRKRVLVRVALPPMSVTRIDCVPYSRPREKYAVLTQDYRCKAGNAELTFDAKTGSLASYKKDGKEYLSGKISFKIYSDQADAWGMTKQQTQKMGEELKTFRLMTKEESVEFCDFSTAAPLRITEDGELTTTVEALLICDGNKITADYEISKTSGEVTVRVRAQLTETDKMLKMHVPSAVDGDFIGQTSFGAETFQKDGQDCVSQRWVKLDDGARALAILKKGVYGCSYEQGGINLSLTRTPVYCCHPVDGYPLLQDGRNYEHMDLNTNSFEFKLVAGGSEEIEKTLERKAKTFNEAPYSLNIFPHEDHSVRTENLLTLSGNVTLEAFRKSRNGGYILRLFNGAAHDSETTLETALFGVKERLSFKPYEVKTFRIDGGKLEECEQMEI